MAKVYVFELDVNTVIQSGKRKLIMLLATAILFISRSVIGVLDPYVQV